MQATKEGIKEWKDRGGGASAFDVGGADAGSMNALPVSNALRAGNAAMYSPPMQAAAATTAPAPAPASGLGGFSIGPPAPAPAPVPIGGPLPGPAPAGGVPPEIAEDLERARLMSLGMPELQALIEDLRKKAYEDAKVKPVREQLMMAVKSLYAIAKHGQALKQSTASSAAGGKPDALRNLDVITAELYKTWRGCSAALLTVRRWSNFRKHSCCISWLWLSQVIAEAVIHSVLDAATRTCT